MSRRTDMWFPMRATAMCVKGHYQTSAVRVMSALPSIADIRRYRSKCHKQTSLPVQHGTKQTRHPPKSECLQSRKVGPPPSDARYSQLSVP